VGLQVHKLQEFYFLAEQWLLCCQQYWLDTAMNVKSLIDEDQSMI